MNDWEESESWHEDFCLCPAKLCVYGNLKLVCDACSQQYYGGA